MAQRSDNTGVPTRMFRPGVCRHGQPDPAEVDLNGEEAVTQRMVSAYHGDVRGELIRWIWDNGDVDYEARIIDGLDDPAGTCAVVASTVDSLFSLMQVCSLLRDEWRTLRGDFADQGLVWGLQW